MVRGPKSGISLTVVPPTVPGARPAPPAELDDIEARIWKEIVAALPPTWLDPAAQQVLVRAVAQAGICESLEKKSCESCAGSRIRIWRRSVVWRPGMRPA